MIRRLWDGLMEATSNCGRAAGWANAAQVLTVNKIRAGRVAVPTAL